jgi:hypothetical protein
MRWHHRFRNGLTQPRTGRISRPPSRGRLRPRLEQFEDRTLLASYTAASVSDLINDIDAANKHGGTNTIVLTAPAASRYVLTAVDNTTDGPTGLPVIKKGNTLTIVGNGDTIERSTAFGTPTFRLFDVARGGSLTLNNLTLQNGAAVGSDVSAEGGAIYSQGTVDLNNAIVQQNTARGNVGTVGTKQHPNGGPGHDAAGGGIWSSGSLTIENGSLLQDNKASGGTGGSARQGGAVENTGGLGGPGGAGTGGGLYVASGSVTVSGSALSSNSAEGGLGGLSQIQSVGGNAAGGGLAIAGGSVSLTATTLDNNTAQGGNEQYDGTVFGGGVPGTGSGGALYASGGSANLSSDTVEFNFASGVDGPDGGSPAIGRASYGYGGALYAASGAAMTLCSDTVESNTASPGYGGGIFIASGATAFIDSFTVANTINNTDSSGWNGSTANIDGTYILQNC